jgi:bifunctional non-homologous end joining protein LigD
MVRNRATPPEPKAALASYRAKRDPARTPEPMGAARTAGVGLVDPIFVIQEHHARALHWDFRLEHDDVLVSWALPKGLPLDPARNHLAVHTEDHPMEYAGFEGSIPRGEYGGGHVSIWDRGTFTLEKWSDREVKVVLAGGRANGRYVLFKTGGKNWMIHRMDGAPAGFSSLPDRIAPMLATAGSLPRDDKGWAYEFKWDGVRAVTYVDGGRVRAMSRTDKDLTKGFPELRDLGAFLGSRPVVLDGELVAFDDAGRPSFGRLQHRLNLTSAAAVTKRAAEIAVTYLVFDVMHLDGQSLLDATYDERRERLESLGISGASYATTPSFQDASGAAVLQAAKSGGLEGLVAKRRDSVYRPGDRSPRWVKVKVIRTQEVVIGGWTEGEGERAGSLGALLLGVPDESGLRYAGKVGTGFDARSRQEILKALEPLAVEGSPFAGPLSTAEARGAHYVKPSLVGEVRFGEWTSGGHLRHPAWRGLRIDKNAAEVVREP